MVARPAHPRTTPSVSASRGQSGCLAARRPGKITLHLRQRAASGHASEAHPREHPASPGATWNAVAKQRRGGARGHGHVACRRSSGPSCARRRHRRAEVIVDGQVGDVRAHATVDVSAPGTGDDSPRRWSTGPMQPRWSLRGGSQGVARTRRTPPPLGCFKAAVRELLESLALDGQVGKKHLGGRRVTRRPGGARVGATVIGHLRAPHGQAPARPIQFRLR